MLSLVLPEIKEFLIILEEISHIRLIIRGDCIVNRCMYISEGSKERSSRTRRVTCVRRIYHVYALGFI